MLMVMCCQPQVHKAPQGLLPSLYLGSAGWLKMTNLGDFFFFRQLKILELLFSVRFHVCGF